MVTDFSYRRNDSLVFVYTASQHHFESGLSKCHSHLTPLIYFYSFMLSHFPRRQTQSVSQVPITISGPLIGGKFLGSNRSAGMQLVGTDTHYSAHAIIPTAGETG